MSPSYRLKERAKNALANVAVVGFFAVMPGTCVVSGVRGCRAEFQASDRTGVMAESIMDGRLDMGCLKESKTLRGRVERALALREGGAPGKSAAGCSGENPSRAQAECAAGKLAELITKAVDEYESAHASAKERRQAADKLACRLDNLFLELGSAGATDGQKADYWFTFATYPSFSFAATPAALHTAFNEKAQEIWNDVSQECGR